MATMFIDPRMALMGGRIPGRGAAASPAEFPGFSGLRDQATGIASSLMGGLPSAAPTQRANAYFGAASGMPGSDFVRNRGFDLYGEQAEASRQRGFDNFLKLLQGFSGTVMPTAGQQLQSQQFYSDLASRDRQASAQNLLDREQMALRQKQAGVGVPWNSTSTGSIYDRFGSRIGHNPEFDRATRLGLPR